MLDYLAVGGIAFGLAYWIAGTGLALWRAIVGALLGFFVGWAGGTVLIAAMLSAAADVSLNSFDRVIGRNFWFAFAGAGYGVHRGRKKLKAANTSLGNASQESATVKTTANDAYAAALAEIEEGRLDKGVWARSFADSGGDESKAKAAYINARAESLKGPGVDSVRVLPETKSVGLYEAAIGEKSQAYYVAAFDSLDQGAHGLNPSWNWAAFLFTGGWALYRKMYGWFFICVAVTVVGSLLYRSHGSEAFALISLSVAWVGFAVYANSIYHHKVKANISAAQKSISDPSKLAAFLSSEGGVHAWVPPIVGAIPVVGIVAAVALPAYQDYTKRKELAANSQSKSSAANKSLTYEEATAPTEAHSQIAEFLDDGRPTAPTAGQLGVAVGAIEREIEAAYNSRMLPTVADIELRYSVFRTEAGGAALQRLKQKIDAKMAGFVRPNSPPPTQIAAPSNQAAPQRRFSAQVQADLNRIAERATKDYPYLDTPAGQEVLDKIIKRRDVLIEQGEYPSIALTRAINDFAPAYAPSTGQENRPKPVDAAPATTSNMGNHPGFAPECRWVTPQKWSCK